MSSVGELPVVIEHAEVEKTTAKNQAEPEADEEGDKYDLDFHDLHTAYKVESEEGSKSFQIKLKSTSFPPTHLTLDILFEVSCAEDYPQSTPKITIKSNDADLLQFIQHSIQKQDQNISLAIDKIHHWSSSSSSLLDLINDINIVLETKSAMKQSVPVIRDFAYPVSSALHWGRYVLLPNMVPKKVRAVFDFDAQDENELAFSIGDTIDVVYERDDGWLVGILNGISGLVPINHIEYVEEDGNTVSNAK